MKYIKLFESFDKVEEGYTVGPDGEMTKNDYNSDDPIEEIEPGDIVHFEKHGTVYIVTLCADGYVVSEDESQRYKGDEGDGFIVPFEDCHGCEVIDKGYDEEGYQRYEDPKDDEDDDEDSEFA